MAELYSDQYTKLNASTKLDPTELRGRVRIAYFKRSTSAALPVASGDTIKLTQLPSGARVIGGNVAFGAMGASATAKIGTAADDDRYSGSVDVSAAGHSELAGTIAKNTCDALTADTDIILTAGGANYAADKAVVGYLLYVID